MPVITDPTLEDLIAFVDQTLAADTELAVRLGTTRQQQDFPRLLRALAARLRQLQRIDQAIADPD